MSDFVKLVWAVTTLGPYFRLSEFLDAYPNQTTIFGFEIRKIDIYKFGAESKQFGSVYVGSVYG